MMDARDFFGYKNREDEPGRIREDYEGDEGLDPDAPPQFDEAITLDDPAVLARIDPSDMLGRVRELPRQLAQARRVAAAVELPERIRRRRRGRSCWRWAAPRSARSSWPASPATACAFRSSCIATTACPPWAGKRTLVIAASPLGETAETLSGGRRSPGGAGSPLAVITTGGRLGQSASVAGGTRYLLYRAPGQPRAAVGFGVGLTHELLVRAGLLADPDPFGPAVEALEALLERMGPVGRDRCEPGQAARLAAVRPGGGDLRRRGDGTGRASLEDADQREREGVGRLGADAGGEPQRDRGQLQPPRARRRAGTWSRSATRSEPPAIAERYRVVAELLGERATSRSEVWAEGPSPLARAMTAVAYGDLVSRLPRHPLPDRPDPGYTAGDAQGAARQGDGTTDGRR